MPHQLTINDLAITPVQQNSPIPLYYQVEAHLRQWMQHPSIEPGDKLPPENELAEAYQVSRQTIRVALGRLVADKLISRRSGHGTVINPPSQSHKFSLSRSFSQQMAALGLRPSSQVLYQRAHPIAEGDPDILQPYVGAACLHLKRLRLGDLDPIGLQYAYVLMERCPDLETYDFGQRSLYQVLQEQYQLKIGQIVHTVSAVNADPEQARALRVDPGVALLLVKTSAFLPEQELIEYSEAYYRADKYEYTTSELYGGV
jgi:GntR family transcriptional regulator